VLFFAVFLCASPLVAQRSPNSNPLYQQLRGLLPAGDAVTVSNFELHRDAATFAFARGDFAFYGEVNGKVTGAVFRGQGHFHLTPPTPEERHNLKILTKTEEFDEDFDRVVLRFTDDTAKEIHAAAAAKAQPDIVFGQSAEEYRDFQRKKLLQNIDLRLLEDVLSPSQSGFFLAAIRGSTNRHLVLTIDPHGARRVSPEEVSLLSWSDWGETYPAAFPSKQGSVGPGAGHDQQNGTYRITHEDLDISIEKNGFLTGSALVHLTALEDGIAVVRLSLYPTLRVSRVETAQGDPLDYVQEKKEEDADFGLILPSPLKKGESVAVRINYGGKDVVQNEGGANYYPMARESWYPNAARGLGDYATYTMRFHVPKGLQLIATGTRLSETNDGKLTTSEWKTDVPLAVVGFNLGKFAMKEAEVDVKNGDKLTIAGYANTTPPDSMARVEPAMERDIDAGTQGAPLGNFSAVSMLPMQLSEARVAAELYNTYYGPLPFARVAVTQQYACNYGQSWPMLVYLPICGFLDKTQQHFMGLRPDDMYWKVVTPHEVAHQWWGQTVGFRSYRDQWMSEGFADASATIFLQSTQPKPDNFRDFWKQQRRLLTEKNAQGFRPIDVGPVTMGFRLSTERAGWNVYRDLVYPKGAYILHMIRMMMWTPQDGDTQFKAMMHDFLAAYRLQAATTEDFKAVVEKHMSSGMDLDGNHRLDWFFNQYVYGTDLPAYHFESQVIQKGDATSLHFKITQSGVPANFRMLVPIYLEMADGRFLRLGSAAILGPTSAEQTVELPKLPVPVKRAVINYYYDVLCTET
jgi:hypothetical protein